MRILQPRALRPGDEVAVVAPAGAVRDQAALQRGLDRLRRWGLFPDVLPSVHSQLDWPAGSPLAASDAVRLGDLQRAFAEPRYRAVFCARGGYGTTRLLDQLDWAALAAAPKFLIGYSDITALQAAAWRQLRLVTLHGPMVATSTELDPGPDGWELQRQLLFAPARPPALPWLAEAATVLVPGVAEGPLLGGNLSLLCALLGTPWAPDLQGAILCLEDVGEAPYRLDRMLTQLASAGVFRQVAGVALGDFHQPNTPAASVDPGTLAVLRERLAGLPVPVVAGLPFGHRPGSWTLPLGAPARLRAAPPTDQPTACPLELLPHATSP